MRASAPELEPKPKRRRRRRRKRIVVAVEQRSLLPPGFYRQHWSVRLLAALAGLTAALWALVEMLRSSMYH